MALRKRYHTQRLSMRLTLFHCITPLFNSCVVSMLWGFMAIKVDWMKMAVITPSFSQITFFPPLFLFLSTCHTVRQCNTYCSLAMAHSLTNQHHQTCHQITLSN